MNELILEDKITYVIQVVFDDDNCVVVKEYENDRIPADDLFEIAKTYEKHQDVVGLRIIKATTRYNVIDMPCETEN